MAKKKTGTEDPFIKKYPLIAMSSTCSETFTFPIDYVKTQLQIHKKRAAAEKMSTWSIIQRTGLRNLYRGVIPANIRHYVYTGARYSIYEATRYKIQDYVPSGLVSKILSGALAGTCGQLIASPTDLVKVRMINGAGNPAYQTLRSTVKAVLKEEGFIGMWKGVFANCSRACLVNIGELASYDISKQAVLKYTPIGDNLWCHSIASICSGFFSSLLSTPADTIKSKMMSASELAYKGTFDCVLQTLKQEGLVGMYRGFFHCWIRLGPWQFIFWNSYETLRKVFGLHSF